MSDLVTLTLEAKSLPDSGDWQNMIERLQEDGLVDVRLEANVTTFHFSVGGFEAMQSWLAERDCRRERYVDEATF